MNKSLLTILCFFCISLIAYSQESRIDIKRNVVIASNGLNLREYPNRGAKILASMRFGEKVNIVSTKSFGTETIGINFNTPETYQRMSLYDKHVDNASDIQAIKGDWIKAEFEGKTGFVFGGYLGYTSSYYDVKNPDVNKDYVILFPGRTCYGNNIYNTTDYNWYGIYTTKAGTTLKPISIGYYFDAYNDFTPFTITTSNSKDIVYVIGSKKPFKAKNITARNLSSINTYFMLSDDLLNNIGYNKFNLFLVKFRKDDYDAVKLILKKNGISQQLSAKNNPQPIDIQWIGDLDGDNQDDYIINYGESSADMILYLSSEAGPGELVKRVALFYLGYCC